MPLHEELEAIDATLRGEAVDPEYADLAELSLLLAVIRPEVPAERAESLDRRFAALTAEPGRARTRRARRPVIFRPAFGAGLAVAVAVAAVVVGTSGTSTPHPRVAAGTSSASSAGTTAAQSSGAGHAMKSPAPELSPAVNGVVTTSGTASPYDRYLPPSTSAATLDSLTAQSLAGVALPAPTSRKTIESSQLSLSTPASRIATVSQEVYTVVGAEQGIVEHSSVTSAGGGSDATFTLEIPSASLQATLARLQQLKYATVASSTSTTQDVNSRYQDDLRALADARALRISLLKQLANAQTTAAVESIKAQIQTAEATIASDETSLNTLNGQVSYSKVNVQISPSGSAPVAPGPAHRGTLGTALHTALHVLAVIAAVLLVALAIVIPVGLVGGAGWWLKSRRERHLREGALDNA